MKFDKRHCNRTDEVVGSIPSAPHHSNAAWGDKAARIVADQDTFHVSVLEAMQAGCVPNAKLNGNHPIIVGRISNRIVLWEVNDDGTLMSARDDSRWPDKAFFI